MKAKQILFTSGRVVGCYWSLPPNAAAKSMYGLELGDSITVQGAIAPTLFAGRDCVEVTDRIRGDGAERTDAGVTEIEADRQYWRWSMFTKAVPARPPGPKRRSSYATSSADGPCEPRARSTAAQRGPPRPSMFGFRTPARGQSRSRTGSEAPTTSPAESPSSDRERPDRRGAYGGRARRPRRPRSGLRGRWNVRGRACGGSTALPIALAVGAAGALGARADRCAGERSARRWRPGRSPRRPRRRPTARPRPRPALRPTRARIPSSRRPARTESASRSWGAASRPSRVRRNSTSATERACSSRAAIDDLGEHVGLALDDRRCELGALADQPQHVAARVAVAEAEQLGVAVRQIGLGDALGRSQVALHRRHAERQIVGATTAPPGRRARPADRRPAWPYAARS